MIQKKVRFYPSTHISLSCAEATHSENNGTKTEIKRVLLMLWVVRDKLDPQIVRSVNVNIVTLFPSVHVRD